MYLHTADKRPTKSFLVSYLPLYDVLQTSLSDATPKEKVSHVRYVPLLTDEHRTLLEKTMKNDASSRARARAHGLVRRGQGVTINAIANMYHVDRDTVSPWITQWEHQGAASVHDQPRSGRPPKRTPDEHALALTYMQEELRSLTQVVDRFAHKTAKRLSLSALKRLAKRARLRGKRVRQALKSLRDPEAFAQGQRALEAFQHQEDAGKIPR